jgi:carboxyl-terminal processing protease
MIGRKLLSSLAGSAIVGLVAFAGGCGGGGSGGTLVQPPSSCTVPEQNQFILAAMQEYYLWNDRLPALDPSAYASPEAFLAALRVPEDIFSYLTSQAEEDAYFGAGQYAGIGFESRQRDGEVRLLDVYEGSPADVGGLKRGDSILFVEGRPIADILANEGFTASLGPPEVGVTVELGWRDADGSEFSAVFTKAVVTIPPVSSATVLDTAAGSVGFLNFRAFVEPADAALNQAFSDFRAAGISELVVDLRYNSGGLLSIAQVLANLVGGTITQNQVLYTLEYNADKAYLNETRYFSDTPNAVDMQRVVFITTGATASASEMVINGLMPFVDVVIVGDTTFGKPVGQLGFLFCERVLRPVSFRTVNALGNTDFFDGFAPDCQAADDINHVFGDPAEASLAEAIHYLETGACSAAAAAAARSPLPAAKAAAPSSRWKLFDAH